MPRSLSHLLLRIAAVPVSAWPPPPATAPLVTAAVVAGAGIALTLGFAVSDDVKLLLRLGDEEHAPMASAIRVHANVADVVLMETS
jgi:hypothetical protein